MYKNLIHHNKLQLNKVIYQVLNLNHFITNIPSSNKVNKNLFNLNLANQ